MSIWQKILSASGSTADGGGNELIGDHNLPMPDSPTKNVELASAVVVSPVDLIVVNDNIYILGNAGVTKFNYATKTLSKNWVAQGGRRIVRNILTGDMYVVHSGGVAKITEAGVLSANWLPNDGTSGAISDVSVAPDGFLYATASMGYIHRINIATGAVTHRWATVPITNGATSNDAQLYLLKPDTLYYVQPNTITAVTLSNSVSEVYRLSSGTFSLTVFGAVNTRGNLYTYGTSQSGVDTREFDVSNNQITSFNSSINIVTRRFICDASGTVFIPDRLGNRINKISPSRVATMAWGGLSFSAGPEALGTHKSGRMIVLTRDEKLWEVY